MIPFRLD